jgi:RNA polymerase sigma-70 factor, ECF subfamily
MEEAEDAATSAYRTRPGGVHPFGLAVLTVTSAGIARITVFGDPGPVTRLGFPPER